MLSKYATLYLNPVTKWHKTGKQNFFLPTRRIEQMGFILKVLKPPELKNTLLINHIHMIRSTGIHQKLLSLVNMILVFLSHILNKDVKHPCARAPCHSEIKPFLIISLQSKN